MAGRPPQPAPRAQKQSVATNRPPRGLVAPSGFTLIELLVVVSIIALLISILIPTLRNARNQAKAAVCASNLHVLGQGMSTYAQNHADVLPPGRLPKIDDCNAYAVIRGGRKYRPTFLAVLGAEVGLPAFDDPQPCGSTFDRFGEKGDRQNYASSAYVCPAVPSWTDERNGAYAYNYQFLGNSRLRDPAVLDSYRNWPVPLSRIRSPGATVAVGDCMGTAASWPRNQRREYENNARDADRFGNEGFNLDPPRVDAVNGEMANFDATPQSRSAADPRHRGRASILWLDGHTDPQTLGGLGYSVNPDGVVTFDGDNTLWSGTHQDTAWTP
jgi:prepilin-type N-terminal cleavage/methylation domain-containing protein/prepilin-type processing-associated H-X9-DG protein